jgi:T5SS/PEP-CTERM-associated repeat protein
VGDLAAGTLYIQDGGSVSNSLGVIGKQADSVGIANVIGANAVWNNSGYLRVGDHGDGTLLVESGGHVTNTDGFIGHNAGSMGVVTVTGANAEWNSTLDVFVGFLGDGALNVQEGGLVSNRNAFIATFEGSTGEVTVTGANAVWNNTENIVVGELSGGTLNIEAGGRVNNDSASISRDIGSISEATVTGANSVWHNVGDLSVGEFGDGTLNILDGGRVENTVGFLGANLGSRATATVSGENSAWAMTDNLFVGSQGNGTLNILDGGRVENVEAIIGDSSTSSGAVTVNGENSLWNNLDDLTVGASSDATLNIEAGGRVNSANGWIGRKPGFIANVTVTGNGSLWDMSEGFFMGSGSLNIENGGRVNNTQSALGTDDGTPVLVTVAGANSTWNNSASLDVGYDPSSLPLNSLASVEAPSSVKGELRINDRATVTVGDIMRIHPTGKVVLDSGSLTTGHLAISGGGQFIHNGGTLTVDSGFLSDANTGPYMIDGPFNPTVVLDNSQFNLASRPLLVGQTRSGTLNITSGGALSSNIGVTIGEIVGSSGTATVSDGGNVLMGNYVYVGGTFDTPGGTGSLTILDGGHVATNTLKIWDTSHVLLNGGTLSFDTTDSQSMDNLLFAKGALRITSDDLVIGEAGIFGRELNVAPDQSISVLNRTTIDPGSRLVVLGNFSSFNLDNYGEMILADAVVGGNVYHYPNTSSTSVFGVSEFEGSLSGAGTISGPGTSFFTGTHDPILMTFEGSAVYSQNASLIVDMGLNTFGAFPPNDQINVEGSLELGGDLVLQHVNNFSPAPLDTFTIANAGHIFPESNFDIIQNQQLDNGLLLIPEKTDTQYNLITAIPADFDLNGTVGVPDLITWAKNFGASDSLFQNGDADLDTIVGVPDLITWAKNFGKSVTDYMTPLVTLSSATAIPEPSSLMLTGLGALAMMRRTRHRAV